MNFEIIDNNSLKEYMIIWKTSEWENSTYGDVLLSPDCVAFGVRKDGIPEAFIIFELKDEYAEIKMLNYHSYDVLKELIERFSNYCHSLNVSRLKYELRIQEADEKTIKAIMTENGWNEPQNKCKIYGLMKGAVPLSKKTKGNHPKGEVVPFFDTSSKQRTELAMKLPEDSFYYKVENVMEELSFAYVEEGSINGFILAENRHDGIYMEMDRMSAEPVSIVNIITVCTDKILENCVYRIYVIVKAKYGEQLIKNIFVNQIISSEVIIFEE